MNTCRDVACAVTLECPDKDVDVVSVDSHSNQLCRSSSTRQVALHWASHSWTADDFQRSDNSRSLQPTIPELLLPDYILTTNYIVKKTLNFRAFLNSYLRRCGGYAISAVCLSFCLSVYVQDCRKSNQPISLKLGVMIGSIPIGRTDNIWR